MSWFAEILAATALRRRTRPHGSLRHFLGTTALILMFVGAAVAGVLLDRAVRLLSPGADVRSFVASHALLFYVAFFVLRMLPRESVLAPVKPLLLLPFRRWTLAAARTVTQLCHVTNLAVMPFTFCAAYVYLAPASSPGSLKAAFAAGTVLLLATLDWGAQLVTAAIVDRAWILLLIVVPSLALAVVPDAAQFLFSVSRKGFTPDRERVLVFPLASFLLTGGVACLSFFRTRGLLYLDEERPRTRAPHRPWGAGASLSARTTRSLDWTFLVYEMKLISRQPRTRQLMLLTTPASWFLSAFFLTRGGHGYWNLFFASIAALMVANAYGVRLFGWEGAHFTGLRAWPAHDQTYLRAKVTLLRMMLGVSFLPLFVGVFVQDQPLPVASFIVCFITVCPYLLIVSGLWNRQYMQTSEGILLNYQGLDLLELGSLPFFAFLAVEAGMTAVLGARVLSLINFALAAAVLALGSSLDHLLAGQYAQRKYALFGAFRSHTGEPA